MAKSSVHKSLMAYRHLDFVRVWCVVTAHPHLEHTHTHTHTHMYTHSHARMQARTNDAIIMSNIHVYVSIDGSIYRPIDLRTNK